MLPRVGTYTLFSLNLESPSQAKKIFPIKKKKKRILEENEVTGKQRMNLHGFVAVLGKRKEQKKRHFF